MKILGQSQNANSLLLVSAIRPQYWKLVLPFSGDTDYCQKVTQLGTRLILRYYGKWDNGRPWDNTSPGEFVSHCASQATFQYAWAVETPNEPHAEGGEVNTYRDWMAEVVRQFRDLGKECIVGNWGNGWSGYGVPGAKYYGVHEYGWPDVLSQQPWMALRYKEWWPSVGGGQLFITEFGVTHAADGGPDVGWRTGSLSAQQYADSLRAYAQAAGGVEAGFVFFYGANADWATFECLGSPELEQLIGGPGIQFPNFNPIPMAQDLGASGLSTPLLIFGAIVGLGLLLRR